MRRIFLVFWSLIMVASLGAQTPIGQFSAHTPMMSFHSVAVADDYVYAAADNGLLLLEKATRDEERPSLSSWSKVEGLSDIDIVKVFYDKTHKALIICYANGNIDVVKEDKLYNVSNVKDKQITGSKVLSHIRMYDGQIFLIYPFGVVIFNPEDLVIEDSWFTKKDGTQYVAYDMAVTEDRYYISTDHGIFSLPKQHSTPANFMDWELDLNADDYVYNHLVTFNDAVYAIKHSISDENADDTLYVKNADGWQSTDRAFQMVNSLMVVESELAVGNWDYVQTLDADLTPTFLAFWYSDNNYPNVQEAVIDGDVIWAADKTYGLVQYNRTYFSYRYYIINGPFSSATEGICSYNGVTAVVPGSHKGSGYAPCWLHPSLSWFSNQGWQSNPYEFLNYDTAHNTYDLTNVIINPNDESEWFVASWGNGLFRCKDQHVVQHYNADNSRLDFMSETDRTLVSGLGFDKKGNLWMTNSGCAKMLKMLEPDGTWHSYNIGSGVVTSGYQNVVAEHLLVDSRGYKWITFPREDALNRYHLVAFTDNGTYDNLGDDKFARVDMNVAAEVNSSTVYCIAEDLDGEIWIGTDKGVKVIHFPSKIFDGTAHPKNILLEQDGYVSVLFEFEEITAIAVDGANRKWIGTSKAGVFLMSEDGQKQLQHFTAEDHPLFSNQITAISVDPLSGEVFFGTSKGLVSYRGTATGGFVTYEELPVYPNPVRHGYSGPVAVNGLKANSLCKITDASGHLIWQGYSNGGELIWYCVDMFGKRPATGVYYVMCSDNETGKEKIVTKFLFVN